MIVKFVICCYRVVYTKVDTIVTFCEATIHTRYMSDSKVYLGSCGSFNYY